MSNNSIIQDHEEVTFDPVRLFGRWLDQIEEGNAGDPDRYKDQFEEYFPTMNDNLYQVFKGFVGGLNTAGEIISAIMKDSDDPEIQRNPQSVK